MAEGSRVRTRKRKQEREDARRKNQTITIVGVIVAVAVLITIFFVASSVPSDVPIPDTVNRLDDLKSSVTDEGYPRLGNPDAPVQLVEYASFACSACLKFHEEIFPELLARIRSGEASFTYVPLGTGGIPNAEGANRTALCALEQGKFWQMHEVLFNWQKVFVNSAFTGNRLPAAATALGLDMDAFNSCFRGSADVSSVLVAAQTEGVTGTPQLNINGTPVEDVFSLEAINTAIDGYGPFTDLVPGTVDGAAESATEEAVSEATEATEESTPAVEATEAADS